MDGHSPVHFGVSKRGGYTVTCPNWTWKRKILNSEILVHLIFIQTHLGLLLQSGSCWKTLMFGALISPIGPCHLRTRRLDPKVIESWSIILSSIVDVLIRFTMPMKLKKHKVYHQSVGVACLLLVFWTDLHIDLSEHVGYPKIWWLVLVCHRFP
jgi:hypothetical protein